LNSILLKIISTNICYHLFLLGKKSRIPILLHIFVCICCEGYNQTSYIIAPSGVIGTYQQSITIDITIDFTDNSTTEEKFIKSFLVEYGPDGKETQIATGGPKSFVASLGESQFKGRLQTTFNESLGLYRLQINDLKYNDDLILKFILFFSISTTPVTFGNERSFTNLTIEGTHS